MSDPRFQTQTILGSSDSTKTPGMPFDLTQVHALNQFWNLLSSRMPFQPTVPTTQGFPGSYTCPPPTLNSSPASLSQNSILAECQQQAYKQSINQGSSDDTHQPMIVNSQGLAATPTSSQKRE